MRLLVDGGAPARVLDIGSGQGDLAAAIVAEWADADVLGIELSDAGVAIASSKVPQASFVQRDLSVDQPPPDGWRGWATHVTCSEVLEHVDDPVGFLRNALQWTAPGSRFVVTVPAGPISAFDRHVGHRTHYTRATLRRTLSESGLVVETVAAAGFPFFNLYRLTVIARGEGLIDDVAGPGASLGMAARIAMRAFSGLFRLNLRHSPGGWQLVAVAHHAAAT